MRKASKEQRAVLVPKARWFDQIREVMRFHHYSYRTEKTCAQWVRRSRLLRRHEAIDSVGLGGRIDHGFDVIRGLRDSVRELEPKAAADDI